MKKIYLVIAVAVCAAMSVSCKNRKAAQNQNAEQVSEQQAQAMAQVSDALDSLQAQLVELTDSIPFYVEYLKKQDKIAKPDYLYDPAKVAELVTPGQKMFAIAALSVDYPIYKALGMPVGECEKAMAKLGIDLNLPLSMDDFKDNKPIDAISAAYEKLKEAGKMEMFWTIRHFVMFEASYVIAMNAETIFDQIDETAWKRFAEQYWVCVQATIELAKVNPAVARRLSNLSISDEETGRAMFGTPQDAKETFIRNKEQYIANRNSFLN